jgi:sulfatase modifying factor 1
VGSRLHNVVSGVVALASALGAVGCGATSADGRDGRSALLAPPVEKAGNETKGGVLAAAAIPEDVRGACPSGMASIEGRFCIDRYEASLVETSSSGEEHRFSPYSTVANQHVRAVSEPDVFPQGYVSAVQAKSACAAAGKRLCKAAEWQQACRGPENKRYGYGEDREPGKCNDRGKNPVVTLFGFRYDASTMNQPRLNQLEGTLAKTGSHSDCSNGYGVYDMVGNLHEWVADAKGTFYGGYYQDVASLGHGQGCNYQTTAHAAAYHDYSTGFRCCSDLGAPPEPVKAPAAKPKKKPLKKRR